MDMSCNEKVVFTSRMANCLGQSVGVRWDLRRGNDTFSLRETSEKPPSCQTDDGDHNFVPGEVFAVSTCTSDCGKDRTFGLDVAYSKVTGFCSAQMENGHRNHDDHAYSLWNQGKDGMSVEKQLSPTSISGTGCHLFEDLVSKILDEDNSSQSISEQGDYFDECFSKNGRKMKNVDSDKGEWFEAKKGNVCMQTFLENSKAFQSNGKNGLNLSQTHSASDIFNLNASNRSWKQKSSSDHFIPDFKHDSFKVSNEKEVPFSVPHIEMKNLFDKSSSLINDANIDSNGEFVIGSSVIPGDLSSGLNDRNSLLSLSGQSRNDSKIYAGNLAHEFFPKMNTCEASQKYDGSGWFLPLGLSSQDYLSTVIVPTYSVGNKFDGISQKNSQYISCTEQKSLWSQKELPCDGINSLMTQNKDTKKVMDALLSASVHYPVNAVRPLLKRSGYEFENETKPDIMSIIGGSFVSQDYIHPEAVYSNHPLVPRFVPLALLNHNVRNSLSQVKMTPVFVKPSQDVGTQQMKSIIRRPLATSMVDYYLEHCFEQLNCLEIEESKVESELCKMKILPGNGAAPANFPRFSHNSTRVNHLVAESLKQHTKINAMLMKIKKMSSHPLHANIYSAMDTWLEGIRKVQARRKEEIVSSANRNNNGGSRNVEDKDNMALSSAIEELLGQTRKARTALWCAFQMCLFACSSPSEMKEMNYDFVPF